MTEQNPATKYNSTQELLSKMAEALGRGGIAICGPWDGDLSDEEQERFEGLVAALDVVEASLGLHQPPAEQVGSLVKRALALAPSAGLYLSVKIEPAKAGRKPTDEEAERADMHSDLRRASRDD